jgi:hypothetical protein
MLRVVRRLYRPTTTRSGSSANQYIKVKSRSLHIILFSVHHPDALLIVISAKNLQVPSERTPAGISISVNVDSQRRWKSTIGVLSSEKSVVWGDTVTL